MALLTFGCGVIGGEEECRGGSSCADPDNGASIGRVVCGRTGTDVVTPRVAAQPDGVHYTIDNRLKAGHGYSVEVPGGGGLGDDAPKGKSEHVGDFPPGEVRIGCYESRGDTEPEYGTLRIVAGNSGYRSAELECPGGQGVTGAEGSFDAGASGKKGDPAELTRRGFPEQIRENDIVEPAGYPENKGGEIVRVVRDGRVIASVNYLRVGGGWLREGYTACEGF